MRRAVVTAVTALVVLVATSCTPDAAMDEEQTFEDFCEAVYNVQPVTAEATPGGVQLTWFAGASAIEPRAYMVYRRPAGTTEWQQLEEVSFSNADDDLTYLDTRPAEQPDVAYEYTVTTIEPDCGGESELCPEGECDPAPAATPRQS